MRGLHNYMAEIAGELWIDSSIPVTSTEQIKDYIRNKTQESVNSEIYERLGVLEGTGSSGSGDTGIVLKAGELMLSSSAKEQVVLNILDKSYDSSVFSGLGKTHLKTNIISNKNILTQSMVNTPNMVYIIDKDYDLDGESVTIPTNCVLEFDGGKITNGTVFCNNTTLKGEVDICSIRGTITNDVIYISWFNTISTSLLICASDSNSTIFVDKNATFNAGQTVLNSIRIDGDNIHKLSNLPKITFEGDLISIKNVIIDGFTLADNFIYIGGTSRNIDLTLRNVEIDGEGICTRFITRLGTSESIVSANIDISFCKMHDVKNFCIKYSDVCTGCISNNKFYNIGSYDVSNTTQGAIVVGSTYNGTFLCENIVIDNNSITSIMCPCLTADESKETHAILLYGHHNIISNNYIYDIKSNYNDVPVIDGTTIIKTPGDPGAESEGIYIKGSYNKVQGNTLKYANGNVSDGAITIKRVAADIGYGIGNTISNNTVYTKYGTAITIYGENSDITGNLIVQEGDSSVCGINIALAQNITVAKNTYIDNVELLNDANKNFKSSAFIAVNASVTDVSIQNNNINCSCIGVFYCESGTVVIDGNNVKAEGYSNLNRSDSQENIIAVGVRYNGIIYTYNKVPFIVFKNNNITLERYIFSSLFETNAMIESKYNKFIFKTGTNLNGISRSFNSSDIGTFTSIDDIYAVESGAVIVKFLLANGSTLKTTKVTRVSMPNVYIDMTDVDYTDSRISTGEYYIS